MKTSAKGAKKQGGVSKIEAVRQALATLGYDAGPARIRDYIREHQGIEMSADHVSANKSQILAKHGSAKPAAAKPAASKKVSTAAAKPAVRHNQSKAATASSAAAVTGRGQGLSANNIKLNDISLVKELVSRLGGEELKGLIDVFSR